MNNIFAILISSIFYIASSWHLTYFLPSLPRVERLGLSFLVGAGFTTFIWFLGSLIGLPLNLFTLSLSGIILAVVGNLSLRIFNLKLTQAQQLNLSKAEKYLVIAVVVALAISFLIGSYNPLTAWDSIALYDFRGHAIAIDHDLSFSRAGAYFMSYPLMISLVHAAVYMLGGISAQGIHAVIFAAFIAIVFGRLKSWMNLKYALLACLLIIGQNEIFLHSTIAYTNLPYIAYLLPGLLYAVSGGQYTILFAGVMLGLSGWVRSAEVFWIIGILLIIWQGIRSKQKLISLFSIAIIMILRITWSRYMNSVYASFNHVTESTISHFNLNSLAKIISNWQTIYWYLYLNVISPYLGLWFLSVPVGLVVIIKKNLRLLMLLSSILASAGMVLVGVMIFSTYYASWNEIGDSARRMVLFIIPLSLITAVYALYLINHNKSHDQ